VRQGRAASGGTAVDSLGSLEPTAPAAGQTVFRVWGGKSGPYGRSWTPVDPATVTDVRSAAGLPDGNTATQTTMGTLTSTEGVVVRPALPLDGNPGGLTEYLIPNRREQVHIHSISEGPR
jgi:hypothetical protein